TLNQVVAYIERGRTFTSVQNAKSPASTCADIKEPATHPERLSNKVHRFCNLRNFCRYCGRYLLVFLVDNPQHSLRRLEVDFHRRWIAFLGQEMIQKQA